MRQAACSPRPGPPRVPDARLEKGAIHRMNMARTSAAVADSTNAAGGRSPKDYLRRIRVLARQAAGSEPVVRQDVTLPVERHGDALADWCILSDSLDRESVVVDVGLGENVSFAESLIRKYGCLVRGLDPTPKAIEYTRQLGNERLHLFEVALGAEAGTREFFLPANPDHVSGSLKAENHLAPTGIVVDVVDVDGLFELLGCERIDVLKLDIEGAEYDVIESAPFRRRAGDITQLCVEFHHRWPGFGKEYTDRAVHTLRQLGFRCAWRSDTTNSEFLFVRQHTSR